MNVPISHALFKNLSLCIYNYVHMSWYVVFHSLSLSLSLSLSSICQVLVYLFSWYAALSVLGLSMHVYQSGGRPGVS